MERRGNREPNQTKKNYPERMGKVLLVHRGGALLCVEKARVKEVFPRGRTSNGYRISKGGLGTGQ